MCQTPKVSVLVPVYNVEKYIDECIQSILDQSFKDFELIVVDDASLDGSMSIVSKYADQDKRIRIIRKAHNEGLMSARKTGYLNAVGKYIMFCDSDDYLPKNSIEILYNSIANTAFDIVFADYIRKDRYGERIFKRTSTEFSTIEDVLKGLLTRKIKTYLWSCIFDSRLFVNNYQTIKKQTINEDFILLTQILNHCKQVSFVNECVYVYRVNIDSSTGSAYSRARFLQELKAMNWLLNSVLINKYNKEIQCNIIKRLAILLEIGFSYEEVVNDFPKLGEIYTFSNRRKYCKIPYLLFTSLLSFSPIFCSISFKLRKMIQYMLKR